LPTRGIVILKQKTWAATRKPGSCGGKESRKARLRIIDYDEENFEERELEAVEECFPYKDKADKERCLEVLRKAELK
jgi:hypothetical protein